MQVLIGQDVWFTEAKDAQGIQKSFCVQLNLKTS